VTQGSASWDSVTDVPFETRKSQLTFLCLNCPFSVEIMGFTNIQQSQFIHTYAIKEAEDINKCRKYNANECKENNTSSFSELVTQI